MGKARRVEGSLRAERKGRRVSAGVWRGRMQPGEAMRRTKAKALGWSM